MSVFDWAVALAFDAADESTVGLADLVALPAEAWERFALRFAASVSAFVADAATGDRRHALLHDQEPPPPVGLPVTWLVWRTDEEVQYRALAADEAAGFALMRDGASFSTMCNRLAADFHEADPARRGAEMLQDWLSRELVAAILT